MKDEIKEIREYISCPQFGDNHYGKWGALRLDQRKKIKDLLDCITNLREENEKSFEKGYAEGIIVAELDNENEFIVAYKELKQRIDKVIEYITSEENINIFTSINSREKWLKINHKLLNILNGE